MEKVFEKIGKKVDKGLKWIWGHTFGWKKWHRKQYLKKSFKKAVGKRSSEAWKILYEDEGLSYEEIEEGTPEI